MRSAINSVRSPVHRFFQNNSISNKILSPAVHLVGSSFSSTTTSHIGENESKKEEHWTWVPPRDKEHLHEGFSRVKKTLPVIEG
jgi:hypothetical protein